MSWQKKKTNNSTLDTTKDWVTLNPLISPVAHVSTKADDKSI